MVNCLVQKQPFTDVPQVFLKFSNIHRKTPVLESLFNKIADLKGCNFIKERLYYECFSVEYYEIFKNSFFYRTPLVASSVSGNSREVRSNTLREDTNPKGH